MRPLDSLRSLQDRVFALVGGSRDQRHAIVATMLARGPREATGYWLQLVVALGIATLGLVVGSTAVVIGAMLVAPLMGPIVALAMGFASGSPYLVVRSAGRVVSSVVVVVTGACMITLALPFHTLNAEILARTTPTLLDLVTAAFCALAGVYATVRSDAAVSTTAAGTSIGISLVPPLCASGFGIGIGSFDVATGAALLFLTNFVAIVVVGSAAFLVLGFDSIVAPVDAAGDDTAAGSAARWMTRLFGPGRQSILARIVMPLALLGAVSIPLRRALDEVAWEARVRATIEATLAQSLGANAALVQSQVRVERHAIDVSLVLLGSPSDARAVREALTSALQRVTTVTPTVRALAVPDAESLDTLASSLRRPEPAIPTDPIPAFVAELDAVETATRSLWSSDTLGDLDSVWVRREGDGLVLALSTRVVRLHSPNAPPAPPAPAVSSAVSTPPDGGAELDTHGDAAPTPRFTPVPPAVLETLGRALSERVGVAVRVEALASAPSETAARNDTPESGEPGAEVP